MTFEKINDFVENLPSEKEKLLKKVTGELDLLKNDYENYIVGLETDKLQEEGIVGFFEEKLAIIQEVV